MDYGLFKNCSGFGKKKDITILSQMVQMAESADPFKTYINPADERFFTPGNMEKEFMIIVMRQTNINQKTMQKLYELHMKV